MSLKLKYGASAHNCGLYFLIDDFLSFSNSTLNSGANNFNN